jgi:signal transduction histidine kinase
MRDDDLAGAALRFGVPEAELERWCREFLTAGAEAVAGRRQPKREEAVLRFYSALGEDFRSPVAALGGWIEVLAASGDREAGAAARQVLNRVRRLADDARDSAAAALGQLALRRRRVDLATIIDAVAGADSKVSATLSGPVPVDADPDRLFQLIAGLLAAARSAGSSVDVVVHHRSPWAEVQFLTDRPLPFGVLQSLYEAFNRPESAGGEAISLYLCRALAVAHGGELGAVGDETGTTLSLRLPLPTAQPGDDDQ